MTDSPEHWAGDNHVLSHNNEHVPGPAPRSTQCAEEGETYKGNMAAAQRAWSEHQIPMERILHERMKKSAMMALFSIGSC